MYYTVYRITNDLNGKIYVGVHRTNDLNDGYMGSGKLIRRAIRKYGKQHFSKEYLHIFDNIEDMYKMETVIVNDEFIKDHQTYNINPGGKGGVSEYLSMQAANIVRYEQLRLEYDANPIRCKHCDAIIPFRQRETHTFCDKSCSASYNNGLRHKDKPPKLTIREKYELNRKACIECGNGISFDKKAADCCSRSCAAKQRNRGRPVSDETKEKLSKAIKAVHKSKQILDNDVINFD